MKLIKMIVLRENIIIRLKIQPKTLVYSTNINLLVERLKSVRETKRKTFLCVTNENP